MLTTITPYWGRPLALRAWMKAIVRAHRPGIYHIVLCVGDPPPADMPNINLRFIRCQALPKGELKPSIGYYHNMGARLANTEWIMKIDVDAIPNEYFFRDLMPILSAAKAQEWFNAGMFHVNKAASEQYLNEGRDLLDMSIYLTIAKRIPTTMGQSSYRLPTSTNFICLRNTYLTLGGCDERFREWGWEDYQQIYMLERHQQSRDPLPGPLTLDNVTVRCRDEISRPKAYQLYQRSEFLALLHRWHPNVINGNYKSHAGKNRDVLMDYINNLRAHDAERTIHSEVHEGQNAGGPDCRPS